MWEAQVSAFEQAIADLVKQFGQLPDAYLHEMDLAAGLFANLQQQAILSRPFETRDGRYTTLVHRRYPAIFAYEQGMVENVRGDGYYDLVVLSPQFVRAFDLETVMACDQRRLQALRALAVWDRPLPILGAASLMLIDGLQPTMLDVLEASFFDLVRAEPDAQRCYMIVFCRQWELDDVAHRAVECLRLWTERYAHVLVCFAQSFWDSAGRVFAGRYLGEWIRTAPLLPPELPSRATVRRSTAEAGLSADSPPFRD